MNNIQNTYSPVSSVGSSSPRLPSAATTPAGSPTAGGSPATPVSQIFQFASQATAPASPGLQRFAHQQAGFQPLAPGLYRFEGRESRGVIAVPDALLNGLRPVRTTPLRTARNLTPIFEGMAHQEAAPAAPRAGAVNPFFAPEAAPDVEAPRTPEKSESSRRSNENDPFR